MTKRFWLYVIVLPLLVCLATVFCCAQNTDNSVSDFAYSESESVELHVLMYHNLLNSRTGTYIVKPAVFEQDLNEIKKRGYSFVLPSEVIAYVEGNGTLPKKSVMITFDDGRYNNLYYGLPILEKTDAKALFCIVGAFTEFTVTSGDTDNPNYSHITWEELKYLQDTNRVEIGNHTYNMHKYKPRFGVGKLPSETDEEYRSALNADISKLQSKFSEYGIKSETFAYPFGKITATCKSVIKENGIKMALTCSEGVTTVKRGDPDSIMNVKRVNRDGAYTTYEALKRAGIT